MKCDELKAEQWLDYSGEPMPCYPKAKVDAAIAELKREIKRLEEENKMTLVGVNLHSPTSDGRFV